MLNHYEDIRSRIDEPPKWWDENGVPRYCDFGPLEAANIYATEIMLLLIECQSCGRQFHVCMSSRKREPISGTGRLASDIESNAIHYDDPPNVECCLAGPTMNSIPRRVVEFWQVVGQIRVRVPNAEVEITCDWAERT